MGCENIQSFTIPGAVFAQIWWGEQWGGRVRNGGQDFLVDFFF